MKKRFALSAVALTTWAVSAACGQAFTPGNFVVLQAGEDGGGPLSSAAAKLFLKEIDAADGHVVQTIAVPFTATLSGNRAVTQSGSATSEGFLTRSSDGKWLTFVGYNADAGTAAVVGTSTATVARTVAVVGCDGVVDSTTAISDAYSANNIRSAVSSNGTDIWVSGTASGSGGGIRYVTLGGTTSVFLNGGNPPTNCRVANIFFKQLYTSASSGSFIGVGTVGTGLPTTSGQVLTLLPGLPTTAGPSNYDFYFADSNTLYMTDDRSVAVGGALQKWTQSGGIWSPAYNLNIGLSNGLRHITGKTVKGVTTIWATTGALNTNGIVTVTDTGAASSFVPFGTNAGPNTWWRGIDFVPVCAVTPPVCYANCDASTSLPVLNANDFNCFLNAFAAGLSYANCDNSTTLPVLNANDFNCFLNAYAAGCT